MPVPAYMIIRQYVVDLVMNSLGQEQKIMSERELCRKFEVTRPTVRKALKDLIEDEYLIIRPGLATYTNPRKSMNSFANPEQVLSIGIVVGDGKHSNYSGFFGSMMTASMNAITSSGGSFRIINIMYKGEKAVEYISTLNVDGVIWLNPLDDMLDIIDGLHTRGISVSIINRFPKCNAIACVGIDYEYEGYISAKKFIEESHKNILILLNRKLQADLDRLQGFEKAFSEAGVEFNKDFIVDTNEDFDMRLQELMSSKFADISGIYVLKYETLKILDDFILMKSKQSKNQLIVALEYIMRVRPEIDCLKIQEPLEEVGVLAAEKLAGSIKKMPYGENITRLKSHI